MSSITNNGFLNVGSDNTSSNYTDDLINNYLMKYDGYDVDNLNMKVYNNGVVIANNLLLNGIPSNISNNGIMIDETNHILYIDFINNTNFTIRADQIMIGNVHIPNDDFTMYLDRSISDIFGSDITYITYFTNFAEGSAFYYDDDTNPAFNSMIDIISELPIPTSYTSTINIYGKKCNYVVKYPSQLIIEPNDHDVNNYTFDLPSSYYTTLSDITVPFGYTLTIPDGFTFVNPITFTSSNPIILSNSQSACITFSAGLTTASSGGFYVGGREDNNEVTLNIYNTFTNTSNDLGEPFQIYKNSVVNICPAPNSTEKVNFINNNYLTIGDSENKNAKLNISNANIVNTSIITVNKDSQMSIM
jgi:hypothetical protein